VSFIYCPAAACRGESVRPQALVLQSETGESGSPLLACDLVLWTTTSGARDGPFARSYVSDTVGQRTKRLHDDCGYLLCCSRA
jgi:hypothetical protein